MNSSEQMISELESRRKALNERLMNSKDTRDANNIERELWALRTAIRLYRSQNVNKGSGVRNPELDQHCEGM